MNIKEFADRFVRLPDPTRNNRLARMQLHAKQAALFDAIDRLGPDGSRQHREFVISWIKKAGKSSSLAVIALYSLVADESNGTDREVIIASSDLAQSKDVTFTTAKRIVQRDPWLSQTCRVLATEIVYSTQVRNERTGGVYTDESVLRAVARDVRGLHGSNASCTIIDEAWSQDDYSLFEALAQSPARPNPITVYASYVGLISQQREGVPLYDLLERCRRGDDPHIYLSSISGPDAWKEVPWITERWVRQQRNALRPAQYRRLVENRPATADGTFLTADELSDALKAHTHDGAPNPAITYVGGLDLGVSKDWCALTVGHVDAATRFTVDLVRFWRPSPGKRISLVDVEEDVIRLAKSYRLSSLKIDQWQAVGLEERLRRAGVPASLVTLGPTQLDKLATTLKATFADRLITIPAHPPELREQLESLAAEEIRVRNSRRDLVRFQSGKGAGAAAHDDIAISLALAIESAAGQIGVPVMPPMRVCNEIAAGNGAARRHCYLLGGDSILCGHGCYSCPAHVASSSQFEVWRTRQIAHAADDIERCRIDQTRLQEWSRQYMRPNLTVSMLRADRSIAKLEGYF